MRVEVSAHMIFDKAQIPTGEKTDRCYAMSEEKKRDGYIAFIIVFNIIIIICVFYNYFILFLFK